MKEALLMNLCYHVVFKKVNQNLRVMKKFEIIIAVLICGIAMHGQTRYLTIQDGIKNISFCRSDTTFNQQQFDEIQKSLNKANSQKIGGTVLALLGGGMFVGGIALINKNFNHWVATSDTKSSNGGGIILMLLGSAGVGVGIPVAVKGAVNGRQYKRQLNAMKAKTKPNY